MDALHVALPLAGAMLLIYESRARRLGKNIPKRLKRGVMLAFTLLALGAYFDFFNPNVRYPDFYHRAEFFHYYLGAKYSRELGYTRIYECTAIAAIELGVDPGMRDRDIRDLSDDSIKPIPETHVLSDPSFCKAHFSEESWVAFKTDVHWFWSVMRGSYWANTPKDHGFNAPPVWTMTGKLFASLHPAGDGFFKLLSVLDVSLNVAMIGMLFWAFGWRVGSIAAVYWGCNAPSNFYWTGGAFLRQDWLFLLVASLCLARKRKMALAGAALGWAALTRIFPAIFALGWAIVIGFDVLRRVRARHPFLSRAHRRLIAGSILAFAVLVPASVLVTGTSSYPQFFSRISVFQKTPLTDDMGLETMLVHDWHGRMRFTRDDALDDPFQTWKAGRNERHHRLRFVHYGLIAVIFAATAWALRREKRIWIGQAAVCALVMSLTNLPNYYYSFFILSAALVKVRPGLGPVVLTASGASQILLLSYYWVDDKFAAQSWLFAIFGIALLVALSARRLEAPQASPQSDGLTGS